MLSCPQVVATDSVSGNYSVATVTIHLRNINDHRPVFSKSLYELTVPENSPAGFLVTDSIEVSDVGWVPLGEELLGRADRSQTVPDLVSFSVTGSLRVCIEMYLGVVWGVWV